MIKLVGFDLDGTVADTISVCITAFQKALSPYVGRTMTEAEIVKHFGINEEGMIRDIVGEKWEAALADFYVEYVRAHDSCTEVFSGIKELIADLKSRNVKVVMITGKAERSCEISLRQFGLNEAFEHVETGSPDKNRKSDALRKILKMYSLGPDEMIYIGDAASDIDSCNEVGVQCYSAAWATSARPEVLESKNSGFVFYSVDEFRKRLDLEISEQGMS